MTIELKMPAMSPTMESGTLARWLVAPGDPVAPGDILAEIETDKATMELEAIDEGWIDSLVVAAGTDDVPVGSVIAVLTSSAPKELAAPGAVSAKELATKASSLADAVPIGGGETAQAQPTSRAHPPETTGPARYAKSGPDASALALRIGRVRGIDLHTFAGGDRRVLLRDLQPEEPRGASPAVPPKPEDDRRSPPTPEDSHGRGLALPSIAVTMEVRIDQVLRLIEELNVALAPRLITITLEHFVIKALAVSLSGEASIYGHVPKGTRNGASMIDRRSDAGPVASAGTILRGTEDRSLSALAGILGRDTTEQPDNQSTGDWDVAVISFAKRDHLLPAIDARLALTAGEVRRRAREVEGQMELVSVLDVTATFGDPSVTRPQAIRFLESIADLLENPLDLTV